ncbi:MAG: hypothetical protein HYY18_19230 [Planctomycetes bacterium]|nr:hypothetical protein [Planctomycetota bacterium]
MNSPETLKGLCQTCGHVERCAYLALCDHPRMQCEEFFAPGAEPAPVRPQAPEVAALEADAGLMGLCANCQARAECSYARQPGGVWFCEEYR